MKHLETLQHFSDIIASYDVIDVLEDERITRAKIKVTLKNYSVLWIREIHIRENLLSYSYYWLRSDNSVLVGWDNAPHHAEIETFPHHRHVGDNVESSQETTLAHVLTFIKNYL